MEPKNRHQLRFLSKDDLKRFDLNDENQFKEAKKLNDQRYQENQNRAAKNFVETANKLDEDFKRNRAVSEREKWASAQRAAPDTLTALDLYLFTNHAVRSELNEIMEDQYGKRVANKGIGYEQFAYTQGEDYYKEYLTRASRWDSKIRALLTTDNPGAADTIQTTVAQNIIMRADNTGKILPLLNTITIPFGAYDQPIFNKYGMGGYLAEDGTVSDFNSDLTDSTDGISKVNFTQKDFALGMVQSLRSRKVLSATVINKLLEELVQGLKRGMEYNVVSGPGTGQTDNGMILNATSATAGTDAYETFVNAVADTASAKAGAKVAFMNEKALGVYKKLRVTNEAYRGAIQISKDSISIDETEVLIVDDEIIPTTAGSTTVVVGDPSHYMVVNSGEFTEWENAKPMNLQFENVFHTTRIGQPLFEDSFSKFTLSV